MITTSCWLTAKVLHYSRFLTDVPIQFSCFIYSEHDHTDEEVIQAAVQTTVVESEVDYEALFGPADEEEHHHKPEHHDDDYLQVDGGEEKDSDFEEMDEKPIVRGEK